MSFNYAKLKGKIKEVCDTQEKFAELMGLSTVSISKKLNNTGLWNQKEIDKACSILNIEPSNISDYFFCSMS